MSKPFNDRDYTEDSLVKQLLAIENHSKDGSAVDGGCSCIEGKHFYGVELYAEEGQGFALSKEEREWYADVADWARIKRRELLAGEWKKGDYHLSTHQSTNQCIRISMEHGASKEEARKVCASLH